MKTMQLAVAVSLAFALACGAGGPIERPVRLSQATPVEYPQELWDLGIEGSAIVLARVTEVGAVDSAYVYHSSGYVEFDSAAVAGALELRFAPARQAGERITMWVKVPVRFRLDDGSATWGAPQRAPAEPGPEPEAVGAAADAP